MPAENIKNCIIKLYIESHYMAEQIHPSRVVAAMETILSSDPGITDIEWTEVEK